MISKKNRQKEKKRKKDYVNFIYVGKKKRTETVKNKLHDYSLLF